MFVSFLTILSEGAMFIGYDEILYHVQSNISHYNTILDLIETILRTAQDMDNIPIYSTKRRVKTVDSVYLKTKRDKVKNLNEINDYAGFRILSLFEQNFVDIHTCIIEELKKLGFDLKEFRFFNWREDDQIIISMIDIIKELYGEINIKPREKDYKSIHYLFKYKKYFVEIQLRTLLQDVWAELEHALSYKQINVHPHIKKSFSLLGRDLQTNDNLVSHLKSISDREKVGHLYSMEKGGPTTFYGYEPELIPAILTTEPIKGFFDTFINFCKTNLQKGKDSCAKARELFVEFSKQIPDEIKETDDKMKYILNMEEAFLNFWERDEGKLDSALEIYESIKKPFSGYYMLHFRMGEIYFIKGEIEKALVSFDRSEILIDQGFAGYTADFHNRYRLKMKLAYINWLLGKEYIEFALIKIDEAEKIFVDNHGEFPDEKMSHRKLVNNLCFYYLENYLIARETYQSSIPKKAEDHEIMEKYYAKALEKLSDFEKIFNIDEATANELDTIAWFYFNIYLRDKKKNRDSLKIAEKYCQLIGDRTDYSTFKITSLNIHKNHIQEIMNEK
jgi:ppGpp synthetase/RelA/SpoT-type nucleotidyltranferase